MSDVDDSRSRKRLRVSRACDPCRRRKERCDGEQPSCRRCNGASRTCFYNPYRKRGLRPGYVRTLEILLGLILQAFDGVEELVSSVLGTRFDKTRPPIKRRSRQRGKSDIRSLLESWRKSTILEDLQSSLDSTEAVEDEDLYIQGLDAKLTSAFNNISQQSSSDYQTWDTSVEDTTFPPQSPVPEESIPPQFQQSQHDTAPKPTVLACLPEEEPRSVTTLPSNWSQLIDIYVTETHNWLPIIHKYTLFRTASLSIRAESGSSSQALNMSEVRLLWAVFAYSSYQSEATGCNSREGHGLNQSATSFDSIYARARNLASEDRNHYDLGCVHASLTLALLDMRRDSWLNAWLWVGRAVYTANVIGILPRNPGQPFSDEARRCFLGCFILDTLVATKLGFRPYLQRSDLSKVECLSDDGPEEWELWRPLPGFTSSTLTAPPVGPGRVLSTFNSLCYMTAAIGKYGDDTTNAQPELNDLISYLAGRDSYAGLLEPSSVTSLANEPPHILQAKVASAAAYSRLRSSSSETLATTGSTPLHHSIHKGLNHIIDILNSAIGDKSVLSTPWLPPTLGIFWQILQSNLPPSNYRNSNRNDMEIAAGTLQDPSEKDMQSMRTSGSAGNALTTTLGSQVPDDTLEASTYHGGGNPPPSREYAQKLNEGTIRRVEGGDPAAVDPATSGFIAAPTSLFSTHPHNVEHLVPALDRPADEPMTRSANETTPDGLFSQLVSLDSSEWPTLSEEFMQHLGLSRDGSLFDFQDLMGPHEAPG